MINGTVRPSALAVFRLISRASFDGLFHRQIGGLLALENAAGVDAYLAKLIRIIGAVAHQPAGRSELAIRSDRENRVAERQCAKLSAPAEEERRP